jgi:hypothetical protein
VLTVQLGTWLIACAQIVDEMRRRYRKGRLSRSLTLNPPSEVEGTTVVQEAEARYLPWNQSLSAATTQQLHQTVKRLLRGADPLVEETDAFHSQTLLKRPHFRYEQALLFFTPDVQTRDERSDFERLVHLLGNQYVELVHPLPSAVSGLHCTGFAVRDGVVMDVAGHLFDAFDDLPNAKARMIVVTKLGDDHRLLRRSLDSSWIGAGFTRLAEDLHKNVPAHAPKVVVCQCRT